MAYFLVKHENINNCNVWHEPVRVSPEEVQEDDQKAGASLLSWKEAGRDGVIHLGESSGNLYSGLKVFKGAWQERWVETLYQTMKWEDSSNDFKPKEGHFDIRNLDIGNKILFREWWDSGTIAHRSCGCLISGSVSSQAGWNFEQFDLVECLLAHGWKIRTR